MNQENLSELENLKEEPQTCSIEKKRAEDKFFPAGATAFFITLVLACLAIWFGVYFIMLNPI